jgi:hypothetical protein
VTLTTYANLGANQSLSDRKWDLAVADESHKLMSSKDATVTANLTSFRALTNHPKGRFDRAQNQLRKEWAPIEAARAANKGHLPAHLEEKLTALYAKTRDLADSFASQPRAKGLFLSATPFAYVEAVDYADGFLFDYDGESERGRQAARGGVQPARRPAQSSSYQLRLPDAHRQAHQARRWREHRSHGAGVSRAAEARGRALWPRPGRRPRL